MECEGKCNDEQRFEVVCPGSYNNFPHKLMISNTETKYEDICQQSQHNATIAYNNEPGIFEVDEDGNLVEFLVYPVAGETDYIPHNYEILSSFFSNYHITPKWINCNYTWGWFDEETGHWTGAVGKVK